MEKALMIDHHADLKKYVPEANDKAVKAIIKHLGIALKGTDTALVSCSSKDELDRVRESWCKKKLALTQSDADLDKDIKAICERMKGDRNKSRVVFYYLLAEKHAKLASL
jgi:predicted TIM-barrel fold metal-dependent hydrolase